MKLITDHAPKAVKEMDMKALFGRKVAIDASMSLYQFMVRVFGVAMCKRYLRVFNEHSLCVELYRSPCAPVQTSLC